MLYSPSVGGFYLPAVHKTIPADAVEVSDAEYKALFSEQAKGMEIRPGAGGKPIAVSRPLPNDGDTAKAEIARLEREQMLPRVTREFMLAAAEYQAVELGARQGLTKEQSLALLDQKNTGYVKVKALDGVIAKLREKLSDEK